jgi:4-amino-4-deoxy-L-arabinose transferase-like glycosyltransferase
LVARHPLSSGDEAAGRATNWGGPPAALAAILIGAAALRLVGIRYGLPYASLLDPDEQNVVPRAWRMAHGGSLDPHFFDWPTLTTYLVAPSQFWHASPSYVAGRVVIVVLALGGVAAAWWLGDRSYGVAAGAIAAGVTAVDATHVAFSHAAVTDIPLTTFTTVALALLVVGRFELAGAAIGLATASKYPGLLLVVPLVVVCWGRWRKLATSLVVAAVAFFVASPFVVLDGRSAWGDLRRIQGQHRRGWLGFEHDHWAGFAFAHRLWEGMGPVLVIAAVGLIAALVSRRSRADLVLGSFVVAYYLSLLPLHSHFSRYVLPLVPALGALAGRVRALAPVTLLLLFVPLAWSVRDDMRLTRTDTRIVAAQWIAAHVPKGAVIAAESSTAVPSGYRVVTIPLPLPGNDARPALDGARWAITSGAVADRVLAAQDRYPLRAAFYAQLPRPAFRVDATDRLNGPWVAVYRLYPG